MVRRCLAVFALAAALSGCLPEEIEPRPATEATAPTMPEPVEDQSTPETSESDETATSGVDTFVGGTDDVGHSCSFFDQDCPEGEKCAVANFELLCSSLVAAPATRGEACESYGNASSPIDTCDQDSQCLTPGFLPGPGICVPRCAGSVATPECPEGFDTCPISGDGGWPLLCLAPCDPVAQDCGQVEGIEMRCLPGPYAYGFNCQPVAQGGSGQAGQRCASSVDCAAGLACADAGQLCTESGSCCAPLCDVGAAENCPAGSSCEAFGPPSQAHEGFGICIGDL